MRSPLALALLLLVCLRLDWHWCVVLLLSVMVLAGAAAWLDLAENDRLDQQVVQLLDREAAPISRKDLRARLGVRNARLGGVLNRLQATGRVRRTPQGYGLTL